MFPLQLTIGVGFASPLANGSVSGPIKLVVVAKATMRRERERENCEIEGVKG